MSYINLHSYLTGQDVQYGLIEVGLKHEATNQDYGTTIQYSAQYWNTAPEANRWPKIEVNQSGKHQWIGGNEIFTAGCITGRPNGQGINDTGNLVSSYGSVYRGSRPIISNKVYKVDEFTSGENLVDLFDTDTVTVKLYVYKGYVSNAQTFSPSYNMTWQDEDGNSISEPEVLLEVAIKMYLKGTANEICRFSFTNSELTNTVFNKFTISTELFDIKDFVNNYYSEEYYDYRYNKWYDSNSFGGNKIHSNGEDVTGPITDVVVPTIAFISTDYYTSPRSYYNYKRHKIVKSDGGDLTDTEARRIASSGEIQFIEDQIDNYSTSFIKFCSALGLNGGYTPSSDFKDYINNVYNQSLGYKTKAEGTYLTDIANNDNMQWSPLLLPLVDNNHVYMTYTQSGVFIPLTTDVHGGDPDPGPGPDPGPEETEEADDPETDYDPDDSDGYEDYEYPDSDIVDGLEAGNLPYGNSYNNFVFGHFKISSIDPQTQYDRYAAYQMIMDCTNTTLLEWVAQKFESHNFQLSDFVSRVYETPFSYEDIFDSTHPVLSGAPSYGYMGPVTRGLLYTPDSQNPLGPGSDYKWDSNNVHYFNFSPYRYFPIDLGTQNIEKVFDNYLDYKCQYTLNLPYGGPQVDIDPNYLFGDSNKGTIKIKGVFDIDTGTLYIKVLVGPYSYSGEYLQLYYQTIVNVASDKVVSAVDAGVRTESSVKMGLAIAGAVGSIAMGIGRGKFGNGDPYAGNSRGASERRKARDAAIEAAEIEKSERMAQKEEEHQIRRQEKLEDDAEKQKFRTEERIRYVKATADESIRKHAEMLNQNLDYQNTSIEARLNEKMQTAIIHEQERENNHERAMERLRASKAGDRSFEARQWYDRIKAVNPAMAEEFLKYVMNGGGI